MHNVANRFAMRGTRLAMIRPEVTGSTPGDPSVLAAAEGRRTAAMPWMPVVPAFVAIVLAKASVATGFDWRLADALYAWEGGQWSLRRAYATETLLHVAGRNASAALWCIVVVAFAMACVHRRWRAWRRPLACLALSVLLSTLLVAWIKSWSNVDCPWDLARYGGQRAYVDLFVAHPAQLSPGGCFPAGHAGGGYAWMATYFLLLAVRPAWRSYGLAAGIVLGLAFGFAQQLRGAHFLSHDLWSAALCWLVAVAVHAAARQPLQPCVDDRGDATMAATQ
jgi:membrane-associated PAP2 superfamily phosphatase